LPITTEKLDAKFQHEFGATILLIEVDKDDKKSWEPLMPSIISKYVVSGRTYNVLQSRKSGTGFSPFSFSFFLVLCQNLLCLEVG
jgi:hypothetical protein